MSLLPIFKNDHDAHLVILLLTTVNTLLIVIIFFLLLPQTKSLLPKVIPISAQTPTVDFNLVSPLANSTVSGTVALVTTLTNGPKITSAQLLVDDQKVQAVTSQRTEKLTLFWNTTKHPDGTHNLEIKVGQDNRRTSILTTTLNIKNNVSRSVSK